jgi:hypothetical protein
VIVQPNGWGSTCELETCPGLSYRDQGEQVRRRGGHILIWKVQNLDLVSCFFNLTKFLLCFNKCFFPFSFLLWIVKYNIQRLKTIAGVDVELEEGCMARLCNLSVRDLVIRGFQTLNKNCGALEFAPVLSGWLEAI